MIRAFNTDMIPPVPTQYPRHTQAGTRKKGQEDRRRAGAAARIGVRSPSPWPSYDGRTSLHAAMAMAAPRRGLPRRRLHGANTISQYLHLLQAHSQLLAGAGAPQLVCAHTQSISSVFHDSAFPSMFQYRVPGCSML